MDDIFYMSGALDLARQSGTQTGEVPIGAIVVGPEGQILGQGHNLTETEQCQTRHAEIIAIERAARQQSDWRLDGCTLYVTLEPCMMCISAAALSRIERIVFGARSPLFGYRLDKEGVLALYTKQIKNITEGILAQEAAVLLKDFFKLKREER